MMKQTPVQGEERVSDMQPLTEDEKPASRFKLLAQVTNLAWDLVVPIVGGVLLGSYIDRRMGDELTWTLSFLVLGVMIAFANLYNLYVEHGRSDDPERHDIRDGDKVAHD